MHTCSPSFIHLFFQSSIYAFSYTYTQSSRHPGGWAHLSSMQTSGHLLCCLWTRQLMIQLPTANKATWIGRQVYSGRNYPTKVLNIIINSMDQQMGNLRLCEPNCVYVCASVVVNAQRLAAVRRPLWCSYRTREGSVIAPYCWVKNSTGGNYSSVCCP